MKCEIIIDPECEEKVTIHVKNHRKIVDEIKALVQSDSVEILGYNDKEIKVLDIDEIFCITVIDNRIYAICENEKFQLKERLYILEEKLPENFIKINQSCIADINKAERFDASISGTLKIRFRNGYTDYVSRRQLKYVKERIGIK